MSISLKDNVETQQNMFGENMINLMSTLLKNITYCSKFICCHVNLKLTWQQINLVQ